MTEGSNTPAITDISLKRNCLNFISSAAMRVVYVEQTDPLEHMSNTGKREEKSVSHYIRLI
jgi:hypothetical protein